MDDYLRYAAFGAAIIGAVIVTAILSKMSWERRLRKWAAEQGLSLVSWRGTGIGFRGPWPADRGEQQSFHVTVEDRQGRRHTAWPRYGTLWGFTLGLPLTDVVWEAPPDGETWRIDPHRR